MTAKQGSPEAPEVLPEAIYAFPGGTWSMEPE
jgi:hypothetical protein